MSEEEEEGTIDLSDRMAAMDAMDPKRQGKLRRARPAAGKSLGGLVAIGLIGGLAYMLVQTRQEAEEALATAEPEDWQGTGESFGEMAPATAAPAQVIQASAQPAEPPVEESTGPSEAEQAMMDTLAELQAEMNALAELADRQDTAEEARQARIASPIVAFGGSASAAPAEDMASSTSGLGQNEDFVRAGAKAADVEQAAVIANPDRTVIQGTVIQAALETAIDSDLPGAIRAVVSEDVHSFNGSRVLIPRGSKLIGRYNSQVEPTQRRLVVAWDRIVTPDGQSVAISAYGADELGRSGTTGRIDRRLGTRFGSAALVSLISALPSAAAASVDDPLAADLAEELGGDAEDAAGSVLDQYLSVPPTITIDQGARITVMVDRDLELYW